MSERAGLREMDEQVTYFEQLQDDTAEPVVLINQFNVEPAEAEELLARWADDSAYMKAQPGFISAQLYRGTKGSCAFVNVAVWESAADLRAAFTTPEFQAHIAAYPKSAVASPHVFQPVAVKGVCIGR